MKKENFKFALILTIAIIASLGISVSIRSLLAAWTPPTALPPSDNVEAPVNAGSQTQVKSGIFGVTNDFYAGGADTFFVDGLGTGNVGIGTSSPGAKLDVNGAIRAFEICDESGSNCKDVSSGWDFQKARASRTGLQAIGWYQKLEMNLEDYDPNGIYDANNYRFMPVKSGYYQVNAMIYYSSGAGDTQAIAIYKNGEKHKNSHVVETASNTSHSLTLSDIVYLNGVGDYMELYGASSPSRNASGYMSIIGSF